MFDNNNYHSSISDISNDIISHSFTTGNTTISHNYDCSVATTFTS